MLSTVRFLKYALSVSANVSLVGWLRTRYCKSMAEQLNSEMQQKRLEDQSNTNEDELCDREP